MARRLTHFDRRRRARRDALWPGSQDEVYDRKAEAGFTTVPRTLGMIMTLIKTMSGKGDPSRVYLELWMRQRDDGFVELDDLDELASVTGYYRGQTRRARSFREALERLQGMGFIRTAPKGPRKYAFVLILHPHDVVQRLRHEDPGRIPDWWWSLFELRVQDIGATLRWHADFPEARDAEDDGLPF